jgi:hypothetical protein
LTSQGIGNFQKRIRAQQLIPLAPGHFKLFTIKGSTEPKDPVDETIHGLIENTLQDILEELDEKNVDEEAREHSFQEPTALPDHFFSLPNHYSSHGPAGM